MFLEFNAHSILQILRITVAEKNEFIFESVLKINFYTGITVKTYSNLQILLRFIQFAHNRRRESNVFFRIQCPFNFANLAHNRRRESNVFLRIQCPFNFAKLAHLAHNRQNQITCYFSIVSENMIGKRNKLK